MNSRQNISILGCGWLGLELAKTLIAKDYSVKGSTTSTHKINSFKAAGITPFIIKLSEQKVIGKI